MDHTSRVKLREDVLQKLADTYLNAESLVMADVAGMHHLEEVLHVLTRPPGYTTLRLNTYLYDTQTILQNLTDHLHMQYKTKGWAAPEIRMHPLLSDLIAVKHRGPFLNLSQHEKEVMVDMHCGMAVLRGADVFAQGIMGAHPGMVKGDVVSVFADLDGSCLKGFVKKFTGKKLFLGNGVAMVTRQEVFCGTDKLSGVGVEMTEPLFQAPSYPECLSSQIFAQNLPSVVCGHILNPQIGNIILDMCAAPGGKTVHIATIIKNQGRIIALDKAAKKLDKIRDNAQKWGVSCIEAYCYDATKSLDENAEITGAPPYPPGSFDRILVDAPCSALGQRPCVQNKMKLKELQSYPVYQRKILAQAVALLKVGGYLVYSTCTLPVEENENQVKWILRTFPAIQLHAQEPYLGGPGRPGCGLSEEQRSLLQRFDPSVDLSTEDRDLPADSFSCVNTDTIGFFIAKFIKLK